MAETLTAWRYGCIWPRCSGFVHMFLYAGRHSVPRRWAVHLPSGLYDQIASISAVLVLLAAGSSCGDSCSAPHALTRLAEPCAEDRRHRCL